MSNASGNLAIDVSRLPPDVREYIDRSLAAGKFASEREMIIAALSEMKEQLAKEGTESSTS